MAATVMTVPGLVSREVAGHRRRHRRAQQAGTKENIIPAPRACSTSGPTRQAVRALVRAAITRIVNAEATASAAPRPPDITWASGAPVLVSDPAATEATVAAFNGHFSAAG